MARAVRISTGAEITCESEFVANSGFPVGRTIGKPVASVPHDPALAGRIRGSRINRHVVQHL
jgi:hypothetical protein